MITRRIRLCGTLASIGKIEAFIKAYDAYMALPTLSVAADRRELKELVALEKAMVDARDALRIKPKIASK